MKFIIWIILRILLAPIPFFVRKRIIKAILGTYKEAQDRPNDKK